MDFSGTSPHRRLVIETSSVDVKYLIVRFHVHTGLTLRDVKLWFELYVGLAGGGWVVEREIVEAAGWWFQLEWFLMMLSHHM